MFSFRTENLFHIFEVIKKIYLTLLTNLKVFPKFFLIKLLPGSLSLKNLKTLCNVRVSHDLKNKQKQVHRI